MAFHNKSDQLMSDINMTPFVDIVLVLLIIFMISAPMMTQGVDVALPQANTQALPSESEQVIVTVDVENRIFINDLEVSQEALRQKLQAIVRERPDQQVYFRADKSLPYGTAVNVMAEIKRAGVSRLGMVTDPITPNAPDTSGAS